LQDVEFVEGARLILRSPNGTRYSITVSNLGVITATSI
jgi:phosphosulfolactate phosphohydrolase-like enzyme